MADSAFMTMTAPAKVNLALHIVGRRDDGFHLLESLTVFAGDGDRLSAAPAENDEMVVAGRYAAQVPINEENLVIRARDAMRRRFGEKAAAPVSLRLEKNLPVASGVGGGSSDAATAIRLLERLWNIEAQGEGLADVGLALGADVPMCLAATPLLARGVGEEIEPLAGFPSLALVLANPGVPLATGAVFQNLEKVDNPSIPAIATGGDKGAILDWLAATRNDLERPAMALVPEIADTLAMLRESGAVVARMTGSGATCFGLFETRRHARAAAAWISKANPTWFVSASTTGAAEPDK